MLPLLLGLATAAARTGRWETGRDALCIALLAVPETTAGKVRLVISFPALSDLPAVALTVFRLNLPADRGSDFGGLRDNSSRAQMTPAEAIERIFVVLDAATATIRGANEPQVIVAGRRVSAG